LFPEIIAITSEGLKAGGTAFVGAHTPLSQIQIIISYLNFYYLSLEIY
jgi:hypothetical protein